MHLLLSVMCQNWPLFSIPRRGNSETMGAEPKKLGFEPKKTGQKTQNTPKNCPKKIQTQSGNFQNESGSR